MENKTMTVNEAIAKIHAPKGLTSIIEGLIEGDLSVLPHQRGIDASIEIADSYLKKIHERIEKCESDAAYWSLIGDREYWQAVRNILEAASLNNGVVAFVESPELDGALIVMDAISRVTKYGLKVLNDTKALNK